MLNKRQIIILFGTALLLLIPLLGMQLSPEVHWTPLDFVVAGGLLIGTGFLGEFALRKTRKTPYRIAIYSALLIGLLLVWAELAVGIFGTPFVGN